MAANSTKVKTSPRVKKSKLEVSENDPIPPKRSWRPDEPKMITIDRNSWEKEGTKRYGKDKMKWKFRCPSCGKIQSTEDYKNAEAPEDAVAYSCVGRWNGSTGVMCKGDELGCNYAGGGLIQLNPIKVKLSNGRNNYHDIFDFADPITMDTVIGKYDDAKHSS